MARAATTFPFFSLPTAAVAHELVDAGHLEKDAAAFSCLNSPNWRPPQLWEQWQQDSALHLKRQH